MAEGLYEKMKKREKSAVRSRKVYALVAVIVILLGIIGFLLYTGYGGFLVTERVTNADEAADTLSELGNDLSGISDDLKDMENLL